MKGCLRISYENLDMKSGHILKRYLNKISITDSIYIHLFPTLFVSTSIHDIYHLYLK
jgi:hypothetical protein